MRTLEHAVQVINGLGGDLVVLTGDYVHRTRRSLKPGIGALGGLKARLGVVAVLGNHTITGKAPASVTRPLAASACRCWITAAFT